MKNISKIISAFILLFGIASCTENDKDPIVSPNGFTLQEPASGSSYVLLPQNSADDLLTLKWDPSNNGVASVSTYTIEIAKSGTNFANPLTAVRTTDIAPTGTYTWTVGYLNSLLTDLGFSPCETLDIDIRVKSTLGIVDNNSLIQYSNIRTIHVTPYLTDLPLMAFSSDGVITAATPKLASSGVLKTDYEGYMWLTPGFYKFYKPDNTCNLFDSTVVYGDDGSGSYNALVLNGAGYEVTTAGFYLVRADTSTNAYSVRPTTWGIFGTAKSTGFLANTPLTYDPVSKLWKTAAPVSLTPGYGFKFRSNGSGSNIFVLGKFIPNQEEPVSYAGPILSYVPNTTTAPLLSQNELPVPGLRPNPRVNSNFEITLDLNSPRNYSYTITQIP